MAMGWTHLGNVGVKPPERGEADPAGLWCLSGGNDWWLDPEGHSVCAPCGGIPNPLEDDAAAMALVKRLGLMLTKDIVPEEWRVEAADFIVAKNPDLNRAIVECVAKMQSLPQERSK